MKKDTNILQAHIHCVGDAVHDALAEKFDSAYIDVQFKTEYAPYGDTECTVGRYIDDDSDAEIRQNFEDEYDFDEVMKLLKDNCDFKFAVMEMVKYMAWNREA